MATESLPKILTNALDNSDTDTIYYLTEPLTWTEAQAEAEALGGNLVTINNAVENQYLVDTFGGSERFWIGLTDELEEGNFDWVNGESVSYTNWANSQPDNYQQIQHYAVLNVHGAGLWDDQQNEGWNNNPHRGIVEVVNYQSISTVINFTETEYKINEDGTPIIAVILTRSGSVDPRVSVDINFSDRLATSGEDFDGSPITVTFEEGETSKYIPIPIIDDLEFENEEDFEIRLINPTDGAILGDITTARVTIKDNDTNKGITLNGANPIIIDNSRLNSVNIGASEFALSFDGDDYVNVGDTTDLVLTDNFTLEAKIYPTSSSGTSNVILGREGEYLISRFNDGTIRFAFANSNPGWRWRSTGYVVPENEWTHLTVTYETGVFKLYDDGALVYTYNGSGTIGDGVGNQDDFQIGSRQYNNESFIGLIDEVRVWDVVRSEAEIEANYQQELTGTETGLIGYWNFDNGVPDDLTSNNNDGVVIGAIFEPQTASKTPEEIVYTLTEIPERGELGLANNSALSFDGNDYVEIGNPTELQITGNQTIEFWIKPDNFNSRQNPYAKAYGGEGTMTLETNGTINYYYGTNGGNGGSYQRFNTNQSLALDQWQHIALVRDLDNLKLYWYINGVKVNEANANYPQAVAGNLPLYFGRGYVSNFTGDLDDIRIWNVARTQQEIQANYQKQLIGNENGLVAYYNFEDGLAEDLSNNGNDGSIFGATSVGNPILSNNTPLAIDDTFTQADINSNHLFYTPDSATDIQDNFKFTVTDGETTTPEQTFNIAHPVDLSNWQQQGELSNGNWTITGDQNQFVEQSINGNPTFFVSPFNFINSTVTGTIQVNTSGDDDYIGFVFGYQTPINDPTNDYEFLLFDWKQANQSEGGYFGAEGYSLNRVNGTFDVNNDNVRLSNFFAHNDTEEFDVLATDYDTTKGWNDNQQYEFSLTYTTDRILIKIDGETIFDENGTFDSGRFGFYNYSQPRVRYGNFRASGLFSDSPIANPDNYNANEDETLTISAQLGLLVNDINPNLSNLTVYEPELITTTANGTIAVAADGSFVYTPNPDFAGEDSFSYRAYDGTNFSATATVTIEVINTNNDAPTTINLDNTTVDEGSIEGTAIATLTTIDPDPDDEHTYSLLDDAEGRFTLDGDKLIIANANLLTPGDYDVTIQTEDILGLNYQQTFTITVNQVDSIIEFNQANFTGNENETVEVTLTRTNSTTGIASVTLELNNGSAIYPQDFSQTELTVNFADGESNKTIEIPVVDDNIFEQSETINLSLVNPSDGSQLGVQNNAVLTINSEDPAIPGTLGFNSAQFKVRENGTNLITVTVVRTEGSDGVVKATINLSDGTAIANSDYNNSPITVTFADGETSQTVDIPIINDNVTEIDETLNLTLINPTNGATIGEQNSATLTIVDSNEPIITGLPFGALGSNQGETTIVIAGQNFSPQDQASLISNNGTEITASQVIWVNSQEIWTTFDLTGQNIGKYDVSVSTGNSSFVLSDAFNVTDGAIGNLQLQISYPDTGIATVSYENVGQTDLLLLLYYALYLPMPKLITSIKIFLAIVRLYNNYLILTLRLMIVDQQEFCHRGQVVNFPSVLPLKVMVLFPLKWKKYPPMK